MQPPPAPTPPPQAADPLLAEIAERFSDTTFWNWNEPVSAKTLADPIRVEAGEYPLRIIDPPPSAYVLNDDPPGPVLRFESGELSIDVAVFPPQGDDADCENVSSKADAAFVAELPRYIPHLLRLATAPPAPAPPPPARTGEDDYRPLEERVSRLAWGIAETFIKPSPRGNIDVSGGGRGMTFDATTRHGKDDILWLRSIVAALIDKGRAAAELRQAGGEDAEREAQLREEVKGRFGRAWWVQSKLEVAEFLLAQLDAARAERDKLAAFKAYVHQRLDDAGVPTDPESPHKAEGCRIGGRLDVVLAGWDAALSPSPARQAEGVES